MVIVCHDFSINVTVVLFKFLWLFKILNFNFILVIINIYKILMPKKQKATY